MADYSMNTYMNALTLYCDHHCFIHIKSKDTKVVSVLSHENPYLTFIRTARHLLG